MIRNKYPGFTGSQRAVLKHLKTLPTYQKFTRGVRKTDIKPYSTAKRGVLATDLLDLSNTPFRREIAALVVIDTYTRFLSATSLRNKTSEAVSKAFKQNIQRRPNRNISAVIHDGGGEFIGPEFQAVVAGMDARDITTSPHSPYQNGVAERPVQTLQRLIFQDMDATGNKNWLELLTKACNNYNSSTNTSTQKRPIDLEANTDDAELNAEAKDFQQKKRAKGFKNSVGDDIPVGSLVITKIIDAPVNYKPHRQGFFNPDKVFQVVSKRYNGFNQLPSYRLKRTSDNVIVSHTYPRWQLFVVKKPPTIGLRAP